MVRSNFGSDTKREMGAPLGILKGSLFGVASAVILAFLLTAVAIMTEDPDKLVGVFAYAALASGAIVCGISTPRDVMNPVLASALSGGGYSLVLWLASMAFRGDGVSEHSPLISILLYLGCVLVSMAARLIFTPRGKKVRVGNKSPAAMVRKQLGR